MKIIIIIPLILILLLVTTATGSLDCSYDPYPYIENEISWICSTDQEKCVSYIYYANVTDLIQLNPKPKVIDLVGVIDKYDVVNTKAIVHFYKENLFNKINYTFGVKCGSETFERSVRPNFKSKSEMGDRMIWIKENTQSLILIGFFILLILIALSLVIYFIKKK